MMVDCKVDNGVTSPDAKAPPPVPSKERCAGREAPAPEPSDEHPAVALGPPAGGGPDEGKADLRAVPAPKAPGPCRLSDEHPAGREAPAAASPAEGVADVEPAPASKSSKAAALRAVAAAVEAAPFPVVASDWEEEEMCCVAANDHYVEHTECPRELLVGRSSPFADPAHFVSLPGKIRLGIRSAFAYGHHFSAVLEPAAAADRGRRGAMRSAAIRTVALDRHRFVIGWQHILGEKTYGADSTWWKELEVLVARAAAAENLQARWLTPDDAFLWEGCEDGCYAQTDIVCRKERLDEAVMRAVHSVPFPAFACDPFLPECPVIALNTAARALTGWANVGKHVAAADRRLLDRARGAARGAYHVHLGRYGDEESEQRECLSVRAACSNGRPCAARFRDVHGRPGEEAPCMSLQGATLAQGVNAGPLSGCDVWYLFGVLGEKADLEEWSRSEGLEESMGVLRSSLARFVDPRHSPWLTTSLSAKEAGYPDGADLKLLQVPVWHIAVRG